MRIEDYTKIVGQETISKIKEEAADLAGRHFIHINSTYYGGGVAEMLGSMIPLFNSIGVTTGWRIIKGNPDFFTITKKFHNALQGDDINLTRIKKKIFEDVNKSNASFAHIGAHDCIVVHDPQPLPLINYYKKSQPWVWRCHIDLSDPNREAWSYLKQFIAKYDLTIVSNNKFKHDLKGPQKVIYPSIDPLSPKNKELSENQINRYLKKFRVPRDKPIICQISRFDKWKDPIGVIKAFKLIKKKIDCRLVLLGSMATDDPEGQRVHEKVLVYAKKDPDIIVICFENNILVNALQRASSVVIQKSLREGFGLTVTEALWKNKPVVASDVGGISLQVKNGKEGYLVDSVEECADAVVRLLENPKLAAKMGKQGHETVKQKFLITRHLLDYISLYKGLLK